MKNNGFDYFLLLFYSQVVGLDARLVGIAITTALVFDAVSDPVVGYWSDNLRSRWGRRHPFMYASAIPVALSYFLLWNPPEGLGESGLFWYLLVFAVCIRTFITAYETPSSALAPELTDDYEERSALFSFRYYFGWTGGNAMSVAMFVLIFPAFATDLIADGRFNRDAYALYGVISSVLIFVSIAVSAVGTHGHIQRMKAPPRSGSSPSDVSLPRSSRRCPTGLSLRCSSPRSSVPSQRACRRRWRSISGRTSGGSPPSRPASSRSACSFPR